MEGEFGRVAVGVLGPFPPSSKGSRYVVVLSDYSTLWAEAFPVASVEATVIARLLVDEIISRHGVPGVLLSDRGTNFLSKDVAEVCKIFQIQRSVLPVITHRPMVLQKDSVLPCVSLCRCMFLKIRKVGMNS